MTIENIIKIVDFASTILLDIEGTTTSIHYVQEELFPYAARFIDEFVKTNWNNDKMKEVLDILLKDQVKLEKMEGYTSLPPVPTIPTEIEQYKNKVIDHLKWQQSKDCKTTGLKKLQGYIWIKGYQDGDLKGHMYEDVPEALKYWKSLGKKIFIYSSGSIDAQKLLFCNSVKGNLDEFIDGNFDTTIGSKVETESYTKIAREMNEKPENIIFFTDRPKEVAAAKKAGLCVVRIAREGNNPFLIEEKEFLGTEDATLESFLLLI